jgi:cytidylate kinase
MTGSRIGVHAGSIAGAIRSGIANSLKEEHGPAGMPTFVTISRQAGAGGWTVARMLAEKLNLIGVPPVDNWKVWDDELVDKVSKDHEIDRALVEAMENTSHPWVNELLSGFAHASGKSEPDDFIIYRRVAQTIRALASLGGAIIIGRGGAFITHGMPGGVHIRLVAPLKNRIEAVAKRRNLSVADATKWVKETDHNRESFYKRYWPNQSLAPEQFTATLNTAGLTDEQLGISILALIPGVHAVAAGKTVRGPSAHAVMVVPASDVKPIPLATG